MVMGTRGNRLWESVRRLLIVGLILNTLMFIMKGNNSVIINW